MPSIRQKLPKTHRLGGHQNFPAVRAGGKKESRGPLTVWALPNGLKHSRLGIGIGRHCGNAVLRNRVKRLLKETFRVLQHDFPTSYDWVISVRPHEPQALAEYQRLLSGICVKLHGAWGKSRGEG
jgi:ribonuclease P protein component